MLPLISLHRPCDIVLGVGGRPSHRNCCATLRCSRADAKFGRVQRFCWISVVESSVRPSRPVASSAVICSPLQSNWRELRTEISVQCLYGSLVMSFPVSRQHSASRADHSRVLRVLVALRSWMAASGLQRRSWWQWFWPNRWLLCPTLGPLIRK